MDCLSESIIVIQESHFANSQALQASCMMKNSIFVIVSKFLDIRNYMEH